MVALGAENEGRVSFAMEANETQMATPGSFWWLRERRLEAIHVVPTVAVVAEKQLLLHYDLQN